MQALAIGRLPNNESHEATNIEEMAERGGFLGRLFGKKKPPHASAPLPAEVGEQTSDPAEIKVVDDVAIACAAGVTGGVPLYESLAAFARLRASSNEARALDALLARDAAVALPEEMAIRVASALADRGESVRAIPLLEKRSSPGALLLLSDFEAERGEVEHALALVERVVARDLDFAGARERLARHRTALGVAAPAPLPSASSTLVGPRETDAPFVLLREVARGGAGAVYEAEDRELGRRVALKIYHDDSRGRTQLAHEARVAASIAGRGIVRVFDVDLDRAWLALEWAPHGSLRDAIRAKNSETLEPAEKWAIPLARALARVHAAGWVHLDVKPANVLFDASGEALLGDFGIARRIGESSPQGSFGYLSPERIGGAPCSPKDDVYGFGRVIEEVLAVSPSETWRAVADLCLVKGGDRPADGAAVEACIIHALSAEK
jgi:eukaryotic-like serine/threonine-protein kinase